MRVLMLSWEYPPVVVGGLGRHVHAVARHLAALGHEVVVLCRHEAGTDAHTHPTEDGVREGVRVVRVAEDPTHLVFEQDLVAWTLAMGHAMVRAGLALLRDWRPDVVHAHDWLVTHPAIALAEQAGVPLVATIHATEAGRHSGWLSQPLNHQVHSVEWWLANRADALITCSSAMRAEAAHLFDLDPTAVTVIHNGIEPRDWRIPARAVRTARARHSPDDAPLLVFFGRLEWEKGGHDLIAALAKIRRSHPGTRLVIAGKGSQSDNLADLARKLRVRRAIDFVGHLSDRALVATLSAADAVVLPSRYEPFGIVALEAAAAGAPLVASTAGGLGEVVVEGSTGLSFAPGDVDALAGAVRRVLNDPVGARRRARAAKARLPEAFDWGRIAEQTVGVYRAAVVGEREPLGRPKIATGNAFG
ncbi:glycosyltransferase family 4 protein [Actinokineospora globicatena]|uniref:glycosyltransferase family 4 protein n=1 Tax=Actinokineospora globicatena TaxID=103729 RepID=UPI0020A42A47|nr:glycosyltransferase family 4 protein [Actinokineospora globicatena]MCP2305457.1 (1->4)-alpha-D-glucan synthase (UDP-glucose) [Actinokineospora globicatena]GLW81325.1 glycogen synthase [Actinokineospora globicatena]GLW87977.1 glycogen synthase [Actinokineospora globicatena]